MNKARCLHHLYSWAGQLFIPLAAVQPAGLSKQK